MKKAIFTILCCIWACNLHAALITVDAFNTSDNLAIYDQTTGVTWLSLTQTAGMTFNEAGSAFTGWRHASSSEVSGLVSQTFSEYLPNNAEFAQLGCANTQPCFGQATAWQSVFGSIAHPASDLFQYAFGLYQDASNQIRMAGAFVNYSLNLADLFSTQFSRTYELQRNVSGLFNHSVFLVKEKAAVSVSRSSVSVNEPTGLMLMLLGVALVVARRRSALP